MWAVNFLRFVPHTFRHHYENVFFYFCYSGNPVDFDWFGLGSVEVSFPKCVGLFHTGRTLVDLLLGLPLSQAKDAAVLAHVSERFDTIHFGLSF
jgi:hypothetical protein